MQDLRGFASSFFSTDKETAGSKYLLAICHAVGFWSGAERAAISGEAETGVGFGAGTGSFSAAGVGAVQPQVTGAADGAAADADVGMMKRRNEKRTKTRCA